MHVHVFDGDIVKPRLSGAVVMVGNNDGVVSIRAVHAVDMDVAHRVIFTRQKTDCGIPVSCRDVADANIFDIAECDFRMRFIVRSHADHIVVGRTAQIFDYAVESGTIDMHAVGCTEMPIIIKKEIAHHKPVRIGNLDSVADRVANGHFGQM